MYVNKVNFLSNCYFVILSHSNQIWCSQIFKFLSFVSMREIVSEHFSFIPQFSLIILLFKILEIVRKFPFYKYFSFSETPRFSCLLITRHNSYLIFSNIEVSYDRLPKHLNSAVATFSCPSANGFKNGRKTKIANFSIFKSILKNWWII